MVLAVDLSFMCAVYRLPTPVCSIEHIFFRGYAKFFSYNLLFSAFCEFLSWLKCAMLGLQPKLGGCIL